jgi:HPt (histidine-containing phosphotransfer) domain-containing protein
MGVIDRQEMLDILQEPEFWVAAFTIFRNDSPRLRDSISSALASQDPDAEHRLHQLKGNLAYLCAAKPKRLVEDIMLDVQKLDWLSAQSKHKSLVGLLDEVDLELQSLIKEWSEPEKSV